MSVHAMSIDHVLTRKGMTVAELSAITGLDESTVWKARKHGPTRTHIQTARRIALAFEMSIDDIHWPNGITDLGRPPQVAVASDAGQKTCEECRIYVLLPNGKCSGGLCE